MILVEDIRDALRTLAIQEKADFLPKFFKAGKGEYGEGDLFLGVKVPDQRAIAKEFYNKIQLNELKALISSAYHEERLTAIFILINKFEKAKTRENQQEYIDFYLSNLKYINNWDLVDSSCYKILGRFCYENNQSEILKKLSQSDEMWHKRIAIVGTMFYIKKGSFDLTKELVTQNLNHSHDLMHKANGWLLREMGKIDEKELINYLNENYQRMPRTSLRYAIERLDENVRQDYLKGKI